MSANADHIVTIDETDHLQRSRGKYQSILYLASKENDGLSRDREPTCFPDLLLDQIVASITKGREEYYLPPFFYDNLCNVDDVMFRHEVWRDLDDPALTYCLSLFASEMREVRQRLAWSAKVSFIQQRLGLHLDAAERYCNAVQNLASALGPLSLKSRGLLGYRDLLTAYVKSPSFEQLSTEMRSLKDQLSQIRYCINIKGLHVRVLKYEGEADYGAECRATHSMTSNTR